MIAVTLTSRASGTNFSPALSRPIDLSRPVRFDLEERAAFGAPPARSAAFNTGDTSLDVHEGAGCNCPVFTFAAHLHGTHTECVGHIARQRHVVQDVLTDGWFLAELVSVPGEEGGGESYLPPLARGDKVITRRALRAKVKERPVEALVVRSAEDAFFTHEAMAFLDELEVRHLLLEGPSVDRLEDEGRLSNHHLFWGVPQGSHDVPEPSRRTITELLRVPAEVDDGLYALHLSVANIRADAAPSRAVLYPLERA